jgi:two-component system, chemotaxis family, protein-glutamate methylesterase/glutaminase
VDQEPGLARVVGVGASAGGVDALIRIVGSLPSDLAAAICVVLHVPATGRSLLAEILARATDLPVTVPADDDVLAPGHIYVAAPDRHLTVSGGRLRLDRGPKENGVRPAVDPLLRSLAVAYGENAVAVILSGALGDGSAGALAVMQAGGDVVIQDPAEATVPSMPESALRAVGAAHAVLPAAEIGAALERLAGRRPEEREEMVMTADDPPRAEEPERPPGSPSAFTCPECHGSLWQVSEGELVRYRCRVGHAFSEDSMMVEQGSAVETALWSALEALEERAEFLTRVAERHGARRPRLHDRFVSAAADAQERAELIRRALGIRGDVPRAFDVHEAVE